MNGQNILAVIQSDLQFIRSLRTQLECEGFPHLSIARNSQEAILYLRGVGIYNDRTRFPNPQVLILDCQNTDGSDLDVLSWTREQADFKELPIFLLCPEHHRDHVTCALDGFCFIVDRQKLHELVDGLKNIETPLLS
jgi:DNA-binding response OmpR family regulator